MGLLRRNIPALVGFGVLGLMGTAGAAAGGEWGPASMLSGLASTFASSLPPFNLASGPANPGDLFFRQGVVGFGESTRIGQGEGDNAVGLFPTLRLRGEFLNRDLTVTTGVNARYLPDLRQVRLQESFGIDQNLVRFNAGPYAASLQLSGRFNMYQQIDTQPQLRATSLTPEGTLGLEFRITERPARPRPPTQRDELSR
jgi:hypothetical protein